MQIPCLYIDIGSTSIKWKTDGKPAVQCADFPLSHSLPPYHEVDLQSIEERVFGILDAERAAYGAVMMAVQMHGYVLGRAGKAVTPYISWRDRRAAISGAPAIALHPRSGTAIKENLPLLSVRSDGNRWQGDTFFTLGSYLAWRLTGCNATHITDAAASGFYDLDGCAHRYGMSLALPAACLDIGEIGKYRGTRVFTPIGDQQAAVFSADTGGGYILNIGTAAQMCTVAAGDAAGDFESRPYFGGKVLCTVTGLPGGKELRDGGVSCRELADAYSDALRRLPRRETVTVCGGALRYHRETIAGALEQLHLDYRFDGKADALSGLQSIYQSYRQKEQ